MDIRTIGPRMPVADATGVFIAPTDSRHFARSFSSHGNNEQTGNTPAATPIPSGRGIFIAMRRERELRERRWT
jgi:hypothetical protein